MEKLELMKGIEVYKDVSLADLLDSENVHREFKKLWKSKKNGYITIFFVVYKNKSYTGLVISSKSVSTLFRDVRTFTKLSFRDEELGFVTEYSFDLIIDGNPCLVMVTEVEINLHEKYLKFKSMLKYDAKQLGYNISPDVIDEVIEKRPDLYLKYIIIKSVLKPKDESKILKDIVMNFVE